jgi:hypothetical protein
MTPSERKEIISHMSFAIGTSGSVKPEKQAEAALAALEELYQLNTGRSLWSRIKGMFDGQ